MAKTNLLLVLVMVAACGLTVAQNTFGTTYGDTGNDAPYVQSLSPSEGPKQGGTPITIQGAGFRNDERAVCRFSRLNPATETTVTKTTKSTYVSSTEIVCDSPAWEEDACPSCASATPLSGFFNGHTGSPYLRSTSNIVPTEIGVGDYIQLAGSQQQPGSQGYLTQYFQVRAIQSCSGVGCVCMAGTWPEQPYSVAVTYNGTGAPGQPPNSGFEIATPSQPNCALYEYDKKSGGAGDDTSSIPVAQWPSHAGEQCTPNCISGGTWGPGTKITLSEPVYKIDGRANVAFSTRRAYRATKYSCTSCKCHGGCKVTVSASNDAKAYSGGGIGGEVWSGSALAFSIKDIVPSVASISLGLPGYRDSSRIFGPAAGGTVLTVSGSNFQNSPLLRCYFASVKTLVKASWIDSNTLTCKTPPFFSRQLDKPTGESQQDGSVSNPHTKVHVTNDGIVSDFEVEGTNDLHLSRNPHLNDDGSYSYIRTMATGGTCGTSSCSSYTSGQEGHAGNPYRSTCQEGLYPNEGNKPCYGAHSSVVKKPDSEGASVTGTYSAGNDVLFKYATCYDSNPAGGVPSMDYYGTAATGYKMFNASSVYGMKFRMLDSDNKDGPLTALDLELVKQSEPHTTLEVKVCAGDFCERGGHLAAAETIVVSKIETSTVNYAYKVYFNTPAYLLPDKEYFLQIKYISGATDVRWKFNLQDTTRGYYADSGQAAGVQFRFRGYTCDGCRTRYAFNPATPLLDLMAGANPPTQQGGGSIYQSQLQNTGFWAGMTDAEKAATGGAASRAHRSMLAQEFRPSETGTITHAVLNMKSVTDNGVDQAYVSVWITKHAKYGEYVCSVYGGKQMESVCDTNMDGTYSDACALGSICKPDNALNGGCGDHGACTLVETVTNGHRLRPESGGQAGPCGHSSVCSLTMTLAPDSYKILDGVDGDVTFEFKTPVPVEKWTTYFLNVAVVGNVDISKPVIWKSGRACGDGGAGTCTAATYSPDAKDANTEDSELRHVFVSDQITGNWEKQAARVFAVKFTRCVSSTAQVHSFTTSGDKVGCCSARASPQGGDKGAVITITGRNFFPSDHLACVFRNEDGSLGAKTKGTVTDASYTTMTCPAPTLNPHSTRDCTNPALCQGTELVVTNDGHTIGPQYLGPKWVTGVTGSSHRPAYLGLNPLKFLFSEIFVSVTGSDTVGDGTRARPFLTIQKGVDAANEFDQLILLPGTYTGLGNRGLRHHGKKIQLKSLTQAVLETIIDCQHAPDGFILNNNKDSDSPFAGYIDTQDIVTRNCENLRIYDI